MLRFLLAAGIGVGLTVAAVWYFQLGSDEADGKHSSQDAVSKVALGGPLYKEEPEALLKDPKPQAGPTQADPVVIPDCHLESRFKSDVPSPREGQLLFIGEPIQQAVAAPGSEDLTIPVLVHTMVEGKKVSRVNRVRFGDSVSAADQKTLGELLPATIIKGGVEYPVKFARLDRGMIVRRNQVVAMLDPSVALAELDATLCKYEAAVADARAAEATARETQYRLERLENLKRNTAAGRPVVSEEEFGAALLLRESKRQEAVSKAEAVNLAASEVEKSLTLYKQHEIRNRLPWDGIVKTIYKNGSDGVKAQEPILQLQNVERLRAEGLVDVPYRDRLHRNARVSLEPTISESPLVVFPGGHRGEVTGVAFSGQGESLRVVSVSEDHTAFVWSVAQPHRRPLVLAHPEPIRSVACSPSRPWCLTGCADGGLRLWDLDSGKLLREVKDTRHRGAVTAVAFSPNGEYFAGGGEDGVIQIWRTAADAGEPLYTLSAEPGTEQAHLGAVTALQFTKQARLVSAGRDDTLRVWKLGKKAAELVRSAANRGGTVAALGVTFDGGRMLLDQGKRLQVLSVKDGSIVGELQGTFGSTPFEAFALFSPDDELLLTAGAPEGRLQLWHLPPGERPYEVRQFAAKERSPATCAAFAPRAGIGAARDSYAVSGTKDGRIYLWQLPNRQAVEQHRIRGLSLTQVDGSLDANARQLRIGVDVLNPRDERSPTGYRLLPGAPVTVVIEP
jgi:WD40 repeat protein